MIKIKIFKISGYHKIRDDGSHIPHCDLLYCYYLFGFLIYSITICGVDRKYIADVIEDKKIEND